MLLMNSWPGRTWQAARIFFKIGKRATSNRPQPWSTLTFQPNLTCRFTRLPISNFQGLLRDTVIQGRLPPKSTRPWMPVLTRARQGRPWSTSLLQKDSRFANICLIASPLRSTSSTHCSKKMAFKEAMLPEPIPPNSTWSKSNGYPRNQCSERSCFRGMVVSSHVESLQCAAFQTSSSRWSRSRPASRNLFFSSIGISRKPLRNTWGTPIAA